MFQNRRENDVTTGKYYHIRHTETSSSAPSLRSEYGVDESTICYIKQAENKIRSNVIDSTCVVAKCRMLVDVILFSEREDAGIRSVSKRFS